MIVLLSGKRKSGKDYVAEKIQQLNPFNRPVKIIRLSAPLKKAYASEHPGVDYEKLLTSGEYKEKYRADMVRWGEEKRSADSAYFVRLSFAQLENDDLKGVVIVSDCRRKTDISCMKKIYETTSIPVVTVRIACDEETRNSRGFKFQAGIDDCETECGLDDFNHDFELQNDARSDISPLIDFLRGRLETP